MFTILEEIAMKFLFGSDPELFVRDDTGALVSGHGLIRGDKKNPYKVDCGAVQVDGMALEYNIDPVDNEDDWIRNHIAVRQQMQEMLPSGWTLNAQPTANFGSDYIESQPLEARELGCDPDFNAYTGRQNNTPNAKAPFRTGAGHIHIGWTEGQDIEELAHVDACKKIIKQLDFALGIPSLSWDRDRRRRTLYGAAGAYRAKPYGVEYRTLSNAWLESEELMRIVFRLTQEACIQLSQQNIFCDEEAYVRNNIDDNRFDAYVYWTRAFPEYDKQLKGYLHTKREEAA